MRSGRSALGLIAGVILGLGVIVLASPGINFNGTQFAGVSTPASQASILSTRTVTMTSAGLTVVLTVGETTSYSSASEYPITNGGTTANATFGVPVDYVEVNNIPKQPISVTGFVLIPVFAALLFGFVLYRISKTRNDRERPSESA